MESPEGIFLQYGFKFDAYDKYINYSQELDNTYDFQVVYMPEIDKFGSVYTLTGSENVLKLTGHRFLECCSDKDYIILVGNFSCSVVEVSWNEMICHVDESWIEFAEYNQEQNITVSLSFIKILRIVNEDEVALDCYVFLSLAEMTSISFLPCPSDLNNYRVTFIIEVLFEASDKVKVTNQLNTDC